MPNFQIIYRLSDNGYLKTKFPFATKINCLKNCIEVFGASSIQLFIDQTNLQDSTKQSISNLGVDFSRLEYYIGGSSAGSWRFVFDYALKTFSNDDIIYFLEDDYLHLPNGETYIREGLEKVHYISLYDHLDKYIPSFNGGNAYIDGDGGELTKVFRTEHSHWKVTNSTTMTFATTAGRLAETADIWRTFTQTTHPNDFQCFIELRNKGYFLATPIPGRSTHCEPIWAAPGIDWSTAPGLTSYYN